MGNWVVLFVIVISMINHTLVKTGFVQRVIMWCISREMISKRPWAFMILFSVAVYVLNMFLNVVNVVMLMIPICNSLCEELDYKSGDKFPKCLYIIVMWASLLGFAATPIGHAIPLMVMGLMENAGLHISIAGWMLVGVPSTLLLLVATLLVCRFVIRPDT